MDDELKKRLEYIVKSAEHLLKNPGIEKFSTFSDNKKRWETYMDCIISTAKEIKKLKETD